MKSFQLLNNRMIPYAGAAPMRASSKTRMLTTSTSNALSKLRCVVEQYRLKNYSEELPSRCKKHIIHAADFHHDGKITIDGLYQIVSNIGAANEISKKDIGGIFFELGDQSSKEQIIAMEEMLKIL